MRKRFKKKKKISLKKLISSLIFIFVFAFTLFNLNKIKIIESNSKFINTTLNNSNNYIHNDTNIFNKLLLYINENVFNSPIYFLKSQLKYSNDDRVSKNEEEIDFFYEKNNLPIIYIYNSHQGETYSYKYLEEYNITPDVLMAANMLKDKLENKGINTLVEENDILEYMKKNNLDHSGSYIASRHFLESVINKYSSINLFIDLHRDAASHDVTYTNINGKDCAKILFVIGLEYSTYENNLEIATKLNNIILNKYPSLTRGIMKKEGYGVNGVYNQDLSNNVILIEVGGNENNIEEVNNTLDLLSEVIGEYLDEKKER